MTFEHLKKAIRFHLANIFVKRPFKMNTNNHYISFTFDDAPVTAFRNGGKILKKYGIPATYYISHCMLGKDSPGGKILNAEELKEVLSDGNELGCHTYSHCNPLKVTHGDYEKSLIMNQKFIAEISSTIKPLTFAYPFGLVTMSTKKMIGKYYLCGRGGGQLNNSKTIDLNLLNACFVDNLHGENRPSIEEAKALIDTNKKTNGWLIFATHDVQENHSPYGCSPQYLEEIIRYSLSTGAVISSVAKICEMIGVKK